MILSETIQELETTFVNLLRVTLCVPFAYPLRLQCFDVTFALPFAYLRELQVFLNLFYGPLMPSRYPSRTLRDCDLLRKPRFNSKLQLFPSAQIFLRRQFDFLSKGFFDDSHVQFATVAINFNEFLLKSILNGPRLFRTSLDPKSLFF